MHSPKCGSGNRPIDKLGAKHRSFHRLRLKDPESEPQPYEIVARQQAPRFAVESPYEPQTIPHDKRVVVFDLETQLSAEDVGGWREARQMRVAVAAVWDSIDDQVAIYEEAQIDDLIAHLKLADVICGFNIRKFDFEVLRGYTFENLQSLPILDLLEVVTNSRGGRLKLDTIAKATLGIGKSADGLQSLEWFKNGRLISFVNIVKKDVEVTRDVMLFALQNGYVLFEDKSGTRVKLPFRIDLEQFQANSSH